MSFSDIITLIIAVLGAILAIRREIIEYKKDKQNIHIYLRYITWVETYELFVSNYNQRPVTITEVGVEFIPKNEKFRDGSLTPFFPYTEKDPDYKNPLPKKLEYGDAIFFPMEHPLIEGFLHDDNFMISVFAFDADGNKYESNTVHVYDWKRKKLKIIKHAKPNIYKQLYKQ